MKTRNTWITCLEACFKKGPASDNAAELREVATVLSPVATSAAWYDIACAMKKENVKIQVGGKTRWGRSSAFRRHDPSALPRSGRVKSKGQLVREEKKR